MDYLNRSEGKDELYKPDLLSDHVDDTENKIDPYTSQQIEQFIQQQHGGCVPAVVFEYSSANVGKEFVGWDYDDLHDFFGHFGEIESLEINGRISVALFKTFFDANTAREFLQNSANFKESEKNNFMARWYKMEDERSLDLSEDIKSKIRGYLSKYCENSPSYLRSQLNANQAYGMGGQINYGSSMGNMNYGQGGSQYQYYMQNYNGMNQSNNGMKMGNQNEYGSPFMKMCGVNQSQQNTFGHSRGDKFNSPNFEASMGEDKKLQGSSQFSAGANMNGKYTCRFEIQIENDKEFQVARRLIGAKGCNMKKIVEICSKNQDGSTLHDAVKLRLRGKGSGYREGPFNKESDESLHLCISSKFPDRYKMACDLVNELVATVYQEYKKFCERTNRTPVQCLALRKEEGISNRHSNNKGAVAKSEFDL